MKQIIQLDLNFDTRLYGMLESLPKVDLHRHLTGSIRPSTVFDIAKHYKIPLSRRREDYNEPFSIYSDGYLSVLELRLEYIP